MTAEIRNAWSTLNTGLTFINVMLFGLVTGNIVGYKATKDKKIPIIANVLLLVVLGLGLFAAIYKLLHL
jgi:hypothetical protein